jgi:hypothetical protein
MSACNIRGAQHVLPRTIHQIHIHQPRRHHPKIRGQPIRPRRHRQNENLTHLVIPEELLSELLPRRIDTRVRVRHPRRRRSDLPVLQPINRQRRQNRRIQINTSPRRIHQSLKTTTKPRTHRPVRSRPTRRPTIPPRRPRKRQRPRIGFLTLKLNPVRVTTVECPRTVIVRCDIFRQPEPSVHPVPERQLSHHLSLVNDR